MNIPNSGYAHMDFFSDFLCKMLESFKDLAREVNDLGLEYYFFIFKSDFLDF